jgi:hypothetical protein
MQGTDAWHLKMDDIRGISRGMQCETQEPGHDCRRTFPDLYIPDKIGKPPDVLLTPRKNTQIGIFVTGCSIGGGASPAMSKA